MIYLDFAAATPCNPRIIEAMGHIHSDCFGNPGAENIAGEKPRAAIQKAREQVAKIINAQPDQIYFTNSATEANNVILYGVAEKYRQNSGPDIICKYLTTNSEHKSILNPIEELEKTLLLKTQYLNINAFGELDLDELEELLCKRNITMASIISANNEIGTIHDIKKIGKLCGEHGTLFHTDATQAIGNIPIDVKAMNIFALTLSGHKIYGPKGVGVIYIRDQDLVAPLTHGGYQNTYISGTQNTPAIVGLGMACELLGQNKNKKIKQLRDNLLMQLVKSVPGLIINGSIQNRLENNLNISIKGIRAEVFIKGMDVAISGGAACNTGDLEISHVIKALGSEYPEGAIRMSLGQQTTQAEIDYTAKKIIEIAKEMRAHGNLNY